MLSKKSVKILSIVLMAVMFLMACSNIVFGVTIPEAKQPNTEKINPTIGLLFGVIRWGGLIAAVVIAMIIGIKFITSSPEGKAEVKKTAMFYVAGIVILLSASAIVTVIGNSVGGAGTVA